MSQSGASSMMSAASQWAAQKAEERANAKLLSSAIKCKVFFFDEILSGRRGSPDDQVEFQNIVQQIQILGNKIYLWNENVFRVLEIKFSIDFDE